MAVVMASPTRNSARLNRYVSSEKDGQEAGDRYVAASGINGCIPDFAEHQMRDNRKKFGKDGTRIVTRDGKQIAEGEYVQAYHVIESFSAEELDPADPDHWERAHELGVELARKVAGEKRLATVHTQIDGSSGLLHNHLVIDSIDKTTGRSFNSAWVKHSKLVETHDEMLREQGFEQTVEYPEGPGTKTTEKVEKSELRQLAKHKQWEADGKQGKEPFSVAILKQRIRETLAEESFTSFEEFADVADEHDVDVEQRGEGGRGISYGMVSQSENEVDQHLSGMRRASKLGRDFQMDAVEEAIERNRTLQAQQQAAPAAPAPTAPAARSRWEIEEEELDAAEAAARANPDAELADQVTLNKMLAQNGMREPDRIGMQAAGWTRIDAAAAIAAWEALDRPETASERAGRLADEQEDAEPTVEPVRAERPEEPVAESEDASEPDEDSEQAVRQQRQVRERQQSALEQDQPDFSKPAASQPEPEPAPKQKSRRQLALEEMERELDLRGLADKQPEPEPDPVMPPPRRRRT